MSKMFALSMSLLLLGACSKSSDQKKPPEPEIPKPELTTKWTPSKVSDCSVDQNVSPSLYYMDEVFSDNGQRLTEPSIIYADETFTFVYYDKSESSSRISHWVPVDNRIRAVNSQDNSTLYDDGTHGDLVAGDKIFTRSCLYFPEELLEDSDVLKLHGLYVLSPEHRNSETVTEVTDNVRVTEGGFFITIGKPYLLRIKDSWLLHAPNTCVVCKEAWQVAGDVFDFFTIVTRDHVGGAGYVRVHDNINGTGFNPPCDNRSHCYPMIDGKEHQEFSGLVWQPNPSYDGLNHEFAHGLLGIETENFPGEGGLAWNEGDGMHLDSSSTLTGDLMGPLWDPARGWPHSVLLEDELGNRSEVYIKQKENGDFYLQPEDPERFIWSDILLYMMGIVPAEEVTETYYKFPNPILNNCISTSSNLICRDDTVVADELIEYGVEDLIARYGPWSNEIAEFDPRLIRVGVLNISDRPHTDAEIAWLSKSMKNFSQANDLDSPWGPKIPWTWSTKGLSKLYINAQEMVNNHQ
ncbi:hypothetical protein [Pleionea sediminis]|uniref:hypothetical protein n=1 Tax=Pleionea sediminis TaxID=2569479 RepID=UPI001184FF2E|nr:hypothetical protein [Pleionea sediminis]